MNFSSRRPAERFDRCKQRSSANNKIKNVIIVTGSINGASKVTSPAKKFIRRLSHTRTWSNFWQITLFGAEPV
jgi:hypothetical protein